jgi:hypothetical protein
MQVAPFARLSEKVCPKNPGSVRARFSVTHSLENKLKRQLQNAVKVRSARAEQCRGRL